MDRRQRRFALLDLQLEAIGDTLAVAQEESSPERRAELLLLVERAFAVYHRDHKAVLARPRLRLLQGGAIVSVLAYPVAWLGELRREHQAIAVAATVGASLLLLTMAPGGGGERPPQSAPTVTATPRGDMPPRVQPPAPTGSSPAPALSPPAAEVAPTSPPTHSEALVSPSGGSAEASGESPPSGPGGPGPGTDPGQPPGGGEDDDQEPTEPEQPDEESGRPCLVDIELSLIGINIGGLVCL